jgi:hypothetical protein
MDNLLFRACENSKLTGGKEKWFDLVRSGEYINQVATISQPISDSSFTMSREKEKRIK